MHIILMQTHLLTNSIYTCIIFFLFAIRCSCWFFAFAFVFRMLSSCLCWHQKCYDNDNFTSLELRYSWLWWYLCYIVNYNKFKIKPIQDYCKQNNIWYFVTRICSIEREIKTFDFKQFVWLEFLMWNILSPMRKQERRKCDKKLKFVLLKSFFAWISVSVCLFTWICTIFIKQ